MTDQPVAEILGMGIDVAGEPLTDKQPDHIRRQRDRPMSGKSRVQCRIDIHSRQVLLVGKTCSNIAVSTFKFITIFNNVLSNTVTIPERILVVVEVWKIPVNHERNTTL